MNVPRSPMPGSWIGKVQTLSSSTTNSSETQKSTSQGKTKTTSSPTKPAKKTSQELIYEKLGKQKCKCGHQRRNHILDAYIEEDARSDHNYLWCDFDGCDCQKFAKKPYERKEHLTNRPFANNTDMIVLKDRLAEHDGTKKEKK